MSRESEYAGRERFQRQTSFQSQQNPFASNQYVSQNPFASNQPISFPPVQQPIVKNPFASFSGSQFGSLEAGQSVIQKLNNEVSSYDLGITTKTPIVLDTGASRLNRLASQKVSPMTENFPKFGEDDVPIVVGFDQLLSEIADEENLEVEKVIKTSQLAPVNPVLGPPLVIQHMSISRPSYPLPSVQTKRKKTTSKKTVI